MEGVKEYMWEKAASLSVLHSIGLGAALCLVGLTLVLVVLLWIPKRRHTRNRAEHHAQELLRHVVITGGSSGIGLAVAQECVARGNCQYITLLARNHEKLKDAQTVLQQQIITTMKQNGGTHTKNSVVIQVRSVDVSDPNAIIEVANEICTRTEAGPPSLLFNVAGTSSAFEFLETPLTEFDRLMKINYMGSVYATRAFLPHMLTHIDSCNNSKSKSQQDLGRPRVIAPANIVLVSSAAGQVGVFGYCAYAPTKYALRGFAEALQMEVQPQHGINILVCYPPDTDTPGYALEQVSKPPQTHLISEAGGLFTSQQVAHKMVSSALQTHPPFTVYYGLEGWMLAHLTAGMSPVHTLLDALSQVLLMGLFRFISLFYLCSFSSIVHKFHHNQTKKNTGKTQEDSKKTKDE
eukprot:scaffold88971_cov44-Attheya_sp.AAC.3